MPQLASDAVIGVLGWTATVCFAMILVPQIVLNQMRKSCEGFSISLLLLWHIGAAAVFPFFMFEEEPLPLMLQGGLFTVASVLCEVQFYAFHPGQERPPATWKLWALGITSFGLSAGFILGLMALFKYVDHSSLKWLIDGIGSIISSLCFALGFIPQINLMFTTRSSEGFSVGVSLLDLTGSLLSIIVLVLEDGGKADPEAIMPYGIIVGMQSLLLFLALVVYPDPKRWQHTRTTIAAALDACRCATAAARLRGEKPLDKDLELPVSALDYTRHTSLMSSSASASSIIDIAALTAAAELEGADSPVGPSPPLSSCPSHASLCSLEAGEDEEDDEGRTEQQEPPTPLSSYGGIRSRLSSVDFRIRTGDEEEEEEDISSEEECSDVDEEDGGNAGYAMYYDMEAARSRKQQPGSESAAGAVAAAFALSSRERQQHRRLGASGSSSSSNSGGGRKTVSGAGPSRPEPSQ